MSKRLFRKQTSVLTLRMFDLTVWKSVCTVGESPTRPSVKLGHSTQKSLIPTEGLAALPSHLQIYDARREA